MADVSRQSATQPQLKVLLLGANGQLGQSVLALQSAFPHLLITALSRAQLDMCNSTALAEHLAQHHYQYIINCAAYTAVDKAEAEPELAMAINHHALAQLAGLCQQYHIGLVHISSDYVFNGQQASPYTEQQPSQPLNIYGQSKAAGEQALLKQFAEPSGQGAAIILRSSWLYSECGNNFVKTMLRLSASHNQVRVVADQIGSPTYAADLALAILQLLSRNDFMQRFNSAKVYHYCNQGLASWYDLAQAVFDISGSPCQVQAISSAEYPTAARRPAFSVLSTQAIRQDLALSIPHWRHSLARCLQHLKGHHE
ncbi:dTDP-4-dehydrorhamnose reductase [Arsukibacterium sp.]|uniref:dTDP-4-dehydrorhamnose reductase n=1 Tax=Arsukibacterium sp. TaxID=1977258 RepID=UPI002FD9DF22